MAHYSPDLLSVVTTPFKDYNQLSIKIIVSLKAGMDVVVVGVVFCLLVVLVLRRQLGAVLALSTARATT